MAASKEVIQYYFAFVGHIVNLVLDPLYNDWPNKLELKAEINHIVNEVYTSAR